MSSWILEQERILQIQQNYSREPMENITCCFLYVNQKNNLEKVIYDTLPLKKYYLNKENEKSGHILPKELVLQLIQNLNLILPLFYCQKILILNELKSKLKNPDKKYP